MIQKSSYTCWKGCAQAYEALDAHRDTAGARVPGGPAAWTRFESAAYAAETKFRGALAVKGALIVTFAINAA